jgi:Protein of unknown function (DUF2939)
MRRTYLVGGLAALLVAAAAGWYFASPWLTLKAMVSAAKANDADRLSAYIDYEALRRDVKADLTARLEAKARKEGGLAGKLILAAGKAAIGPTIDATVSPQALKAVFAAMGGSGPAEAGGPESAGTGGGRKLPLPRIEREGLDRFRVGNPVTPGSALVFERRGLGWQLTGFELAPEKATRQGAAAAR